ncbi:MAG TPA: TldD/PmbA family protein [Petrotogaceae bacterium]|nr:TldD/PmbA family protein [Petrotogaceae bacterium]HQF33896.1 TldD/PmbA family protein [Petrotogaceae bacterium]HQI79162.1 TldD/PmbA family protein [Petrotogaceae bacterium]
MKEIINKVLDYISSNNLKGQINIGTAISKKASFSNGKLEELSQGERSAAGILLMDDDGRIAAANTNQLDQDSLLEAVKNAAALVKYSQPDNGNIISSDKAFTFLDWCFDIDTKNLTLDEITENAKDMEIKAKGMDKRIQFVRGSSFETEVSKRIFANTNGVYKESVSTSAAAEIMLAAVQGESSSMGYEFDIRQSSRLIRSEDIIKNSVELAVAGLDAEVLQSGRYDVIFSPTVSGMLLGVLSSPLSGENVFKGKSFLKDKIGSTVANEKVSLVHDPMNGSAPYVSSFDAEGTNTKKFDFIRNGVLMTYAHNLYSAQKMNCQPTGNAFASLGGNPSIGTINMHLLSTNTRNDILNGYRTSDCGKALYITHVMGLHTADPISGRFSIQISGQVVENGHFTKSFRGMTMAGTLQEMLENIVMVGSDFKYMGSVAGSTTLIKNMSIGGK